jgi:hypothetical protein
MKRRTFLGVGQEVVPLPLLEQKINGFTPMYPSMAWQNLHLMKSSERQPHTLSISAFHLFVALTVNVGVLFT